MHCKISYIRIHLFSISSSQQLVSLTVLSGKVYCVSPKWWLLKIYYSEKSLIIASNFKGVLANAQDLFKIMTLKRLTFMCKCNKRKIVHNPIFKVISWRLLGAHVLIAPVIDHLYF